MWERGEKPAVRGIFANVQQVVEGCWEVGEYCGDCWEGREGEEEEGGLLVEGAEEGEAPAGIFYEEV